MKTFILLVDTFSGRHCTYLLFVKMVFKSTIGTPGGVDTQLRREGIACIMLESEERKGGGPDRDLLNDTTYRNLLELAWSGRVMVVLWSFPCSTTCCTGRVKQKHCSGRDYGRD